MLVLAEEPPPCLCRHAHFFLQMECLPVQLLHTLITTPLHHSRCLAIIRLMTPFRASGLVIGGGRSLFAMTNTLTTVAPWKPHN